MHPSHPRLSPALLGLLACPVCKRALRSAETEVECSAGGCGARYPVIDGVPILLNESNSAFSIADYRAERADDAALPANAAPPSMKERVLAAVNRVVPSIVHNMRAERNYRELAALLAAEPGPRRVLVIGAGDLGEGFAELLKAPALQIVETDVYFAPRAAVIADAHDLPFHDGAFDLVVVQAVLEHVLDPVRCVAEISRVLTARGLVYAESPFLFPVHLGAYDFQRFSASAHRWLFRHFEELTSGVASGPGTSLALAVRSLFLSLSTARANRVFARLILPFFIFWLKWLDYIPGQRKTASDYAAAFFFSGRKSSRPLTPKEAIAYHWTRAS